MSQLRSATRLQPQHRPGLYWAARDTWQLIRRSLLHIKQVPDQLVAVTIQPIMFVVLFRYVFGGAINTGGESYVNFLMAGIFIQTAAFASTTTGVSIAVDMKEGVVDRFRSLPMMKSAVLTGHIVADMVRSLLAIAVMIGTGLLIGFRPDAGVGDWFLAIGLIMLMTFSMSWISAIIGLFGKSVEFVQQTSFMWILPLTFASSAFVPTSTMPTWLRKFSENQPLTHAVEAVRALLLDQPTGDHVWITVVWFVAILLFAFPVATYLFRHRTAQ